MRKILFWTLLPGLLLLLTVALLGYRFILAPHTPPAEVFYQVQPGASLSRVAADLEQLAVVRSSLALRLLARQNGLAGQIHSGRYRFIDPATPGQILQRLVSGDVEKVSITIPEGFSLAQIAERLAEAGHADRQQLLALANDPEFLRSLGVEADSLEGYLFPETYRFTPGIGAKALLQMMVNQLRANLSAELLAKAKAHKLNLHQLLTLASIIEKETGRIEEMPLISSVFHNRLRRGMLLQTDPTVIYGIKDFDGNLTRNHLQTPTPYNTYLIRGLPPGPIASPGIRAILAAADPAASNYLYFVSRGDGSHQFSTTLREHNQAVRQYQLRRNR